jgi:hypothetical protein
MPGAQNRAVPRSQGQKRWIFATESVECVEDAGDHPEQTRTGAANWDRLGSMECPKWSRALARRSHTLTPLSCKTAPHVNPQLAEVSVAADVIEMLLGVDDAQLVTGPRGARAFSLMV